MQHGMQVGATLTPLRFRRGALAGRAGLREAPTRATLRSGVGGQGAGFPTTSQRATTRRPAGGAWAAATARRRQVGSMSADGPKAAVEPPR